MQAGRSAGDEAARSLRAAEEHRRKAEWHEQRAAKFARGRVGELTTAHALDSLRADGYLRLDDVRWPGRAKANIDHVLVGPAGVFVIDAKNWNGRLDVRGGVLRQNGYRRTKQVNGAADAAAAVSSLLTAQTARAQAVLCLAGAATLPCCRLGGTIVAAAADLTAWLRTQPAVMDGAAVHAVYATLSSALLPAHRAAVLPPVSPVPPPVTSAPPLVAAAPPPVTAVPRPVSSVPDFVPTQWPAGPVPREPAAGERMASAQSSARRRVEPRTSRYSTGCAMIGHLLVALVLGDAIGSALVSTEFRVGNLILAVAAAAWLIRLERRRPTLTCLVNSRRGRRFP